MIFEKKITLSMTIRGVDSISLENRIKLIKERIKDTTLDWAPLFFSEYNWVSEE